MPNKRKKGKHIVAAWVEEYEFARLDALAKKLGITRAKLIEDCIRRGLPKQEKMDEEPPHRSRD